jgi:hypothetical protein
VQRFGNDDSGFSITNEEVAHVRVEGWGFWDPDVAADFERATLEACREAQRPLQLELDMTRLRPQRDEGQAAFKRLLAALTALGAERAVVRAASALTKMQLMRIVRENTPKGLVEFS